MEYGQVHHIEYYVNDIDISREFWEWFLEKMGYTLYQEFNDGFSFQHRTGTYIVFVKVSDAFLGSNNNRACPHNPRPVVVSCNGSDLIVQLPF